MHNVISINYCFESKVLIFVTILVLTDNHYNKTYNRCYREYKE